MAASSNSSVKSESPKKEKSAYHILLAVTGSVATIKLPILIDRLQRLWINERPVEIRLIMTKHSMHFFNPVHLPHSVNTYRDEDEWYHWQRLKDPVLHIELRKWADVMIIAPLDANTLAKIANGICDNLLTCVVRAWDLTRPLLFCPAMNTFMWNHPITNKQIDELKSWGYIEVPCVEKVLACGDSGPGGMAEVETIASAISDQLSKLAV